MSPCKSLKVLEMDHGQNKLVKQKLAKENHLLIYDSALM